MLLPVYGNQAYTLHNGVEGNDTGNTPLADYHVFGLDNPRSNIPIRSTPNGFHLQEELVTCERVRKVILASSKARQGPGEDIHRLLYRNRLSMAHEEVRRLSARVVRVPGQRSRATEAAVLKATRRFKAQSHSRRIKCPNRRVEDLVCRLIMTKVKTTKPTPMYSTKSATSREEERHGLKL